MQHQASSSTLNQMNLTDQKGMFELRHDVFSVRLGWDVESHDGQERDHFDNLAQAAYVIAKSDTNEVDACWRLLPTTGPYMLRDTFPQLLGAAPAPNDPRVWEMSRFAVATDRVATATGSFGPITKALFVECARFARIHGIHRYVTVTTLPIERMIRQLGVNVQRIGDSVRIGVVKAVAVEIQVDKKTLEAIGEYHPEDVPTTPMLSS
jgi:acyl homoserine lactone synthase